MGENTALEKQYFRKMGKYPKCQMAIYFSLLIFPRYVKSSICEQGRKIEKKQQIIENDF